MQGRFSEIWNLRRQFEEFAKRLDPLRMLLHIVSFVALLQGYDLLLRVVLELLRQQFPTVSLSGKFHFDAPKTIILSVEDWSHNV